jgi:hypothetical protein
MFKQMVIYCLLLTFNLQAQHKNFAIRGFTLLSNNTEKAMLSIQQAAKYNINHLQLSHQIIMDLKDLKKDSVCKTVNQLTQAAQKAGINEVVVWDHALYNLNYYPQQFKMPNGKLNLDDTTFWNWFKQDYRNMLQKIPTVNGIVLTFIETGARAEQQFSNRLTTGAQKLAAVVNAVAAVVCNEFNKNLYIRTFGYTQAEYANTVGCLPFITNKNIVVMIKDTPHDFFLTHPPDSYIGSIPFKTIVEFDGGNEFNGTGTIANMFTQHIVARAKDVLYRNNVIGYVTRLDRFGNTNILQTPNEIVLYALQQVAIQKSISATTIANNFLLQQYGKKATPILLPAFNTAYAIVTASLYTLGTNTANHSALNYYPYKSSYTRHVSGKWWQPPTVFVAHNVNQQLHYWKDIIQQISPPEFKTAKAGLADDMPIAIDSQWLTPTENITPTFWQYIVTEKKFAVSTAQHALQQIVKAKPYLQQQAYQQLYQLFYRTLLTAQLHQATATAFFGYRLYVKDTSSFSKVQRWQLSNALQQIEIVSKTILQYNIPYPKGGWNWQDDATQALQYKNLIQQGWAAFGGKAFIP